MRIKVDEDLPKPIVRMLADYGHDTTSAVAQGMGGWKDSALWQAVQVEGRFLVTADKGFADTRIHPPGTHAGVLLLRPEQSGIGPLIALLQRVLATYELESLATTVTVATYQGIRIRRVR